MRSMRLGWERFNPVEYFDGRQSYDLRDRKGDDRPGFFVIGSKASLGMSISQMSRIKICRDSEIRPSRTGALEAPGQGRGSW